MGPLSAEQVTELLARLPLRAPCRLGATGRLEPTGARAIPVAV
jgi:hypothetical protein